MYRTLSGQETELAGMIRRCMASPCWSHDADTEQLSRKSFEKPSSTPPAPIQRDEAT